MKKEQFYPLGIFLAAMLGGLDTGRYLSLILYLLLSIGGGLLLAYYLGRKKW